jgi:bifunctional hydroxylase/dehydrase
MLAGELRLAGVRTIVLDRLNEPMRQSRALGFSARAIEEFHQRGLLARFGDVQTIPVGHFGGLPLDFREVPGGSYGARGVPQSVTESVLTEWATELGADLRRRHEVVGLSQTDHGVDLVVSTPDGEQRLRARYVAGCDGARSTVRALTGVAFPGTDPQIELWFADVTGVALRPRFTGERVPGGMVMVLPMGPQTSRVVVCERGAAPRGGDAPSFAEVTAAWKRLTGEDISVALPLWTSYTTDSSRQAERYRSGRVFLLGDAAHIHLPIGAQGMSAGIGDATNLGWKLSAVIKEQAPAELLDTYHDERHPVGARILTNTLAQRTLYLGGDDMEPLRAVLGELLTHEEARSLLIGMVTGLDISYDLGPGDHPLVGRRLPETALSGSPAAAGPDTTTAAFLHAARGVLFDLADNEKVRSAAEPWADRVDVVTAAAQPGSVLDDVRAVLVRPDGYVAWIATDTGSLTDALCRWFGQPQN